MVACPAQAQTFSFTSGTYFRNHLANDGTVNTSYDTLSLSSVSDTVTLTTGNPVIAAINGVTFVEGLRSHRDYGPIYYSGSENFTLDGVTKTLTFPFSVTSNVIGVTPDVLFFSGGNTTIFDFGAQGRVAVTPQTQTDLGFTPAGNLTASFVLLPPVPEASTTVSFGLLLALGLGSVLVTARKKKRAV